MAGKDLHKDKFDKGTITKLEIFEDYAQAWLPTFIMQGADEIHIFDFFSGPGYDKNGIPGSPIRLLQKIEEQLGNILVKKTKIVLHLNEYQPDRISQPKFDKLQINCNAFCQTQKKFKYFLTIKYYNKDAGELFDNLLPTIKKYPSLVYLDQNGVKFVSHKYLKQLESLKVVDFLYFISSSYFKRFSTTSEFKNVLKLDQVELENAKYVNMHRLVVQNLTKCLSPNSKLKLFPFTIKKKANVYGIVFGAKHYAAVNKFLNIAWKRNSVNGEANFDIDEDVKKEQLDIFGAKKLSKIEKFEEELKDFLVDRKKTNSKEVLLFTFAKGHKAEHAANLLRQLKKKGDLNYESRTPFLNYENVFKKKNIIDYTIKLK